MVTRTKLRLLPIALLAAVAAFTWGVAGSAAGPAATNANSTVNIGLIAPTGTTSLNSDWSVASMKAGARSVNKTGGLNGHPVHFIYCNDQNDPNAATACARQMVDSKVIACFGGASLNGALIAPILAQAGIPEIGISAFSGVEYNSPNVYLFGAGSNSGWNVLVAFAARKQIPTAVAELDVPIASALVSGLSDIMKQGGASFTNITLISPTQTDFAPIAAKVLQNGTKAVVQYQGPAQNFALRQAIAASGAPAPVYFDQSLIPKSQVNNAGGLAAVDRTIAAQDVEPLTANNPVVHRYLRDMAAEVKAGDKNAQVGGPVTGSFSLDEGWLGLWAVQRIAKLKHLTNLTSATLTAALNSTVNLNMFGVTHPWTPNAPGPPGKVRASNSTFFLVGYKNGLLTQLSTQAYTYQDVLAGKADKIKVPTGP
jgi:branched-chain amino acid transport system substrate-binding protein